MWRWLPVVVTCFSQAGWAANPNSVWVEMESNNPNATLFRHVGTSYGAVGSTRMVLTTLSKECVAPCKQQVEQPHFDFFVGGKGITPSKFFSLQSYPGGVKLNVRAGSSAMRFWGWALAGLGVAAVALGVPLFLIGRQVDAVPGVQNPYLRERAQGAPLALVSIIGGGAALAGGIPMIAFSGTRVEFFPIPTGAPTPGNASEI
jgi:hypothetical protein